MIRRLCLGTPALRCGELIEASAVRCARCESELNAQRGSSSARGYGWRWRKLSERYRATHFMCEARGPDGRLCMRPALDADHVIPLRAGGRHAWRNVQALCKVHHAAKTRRDAIRWPA